MRRELSAHVVYRTMETYAQEQITPSDGCYNTQSMNIQKSSQVPMSLHYPIEE